MRNYLIYQILLLFTISCGPISQKEKPINNGLMVKLNDQELEEQIRLYIEESDLDPKSTYLQLHIFSVGQREVMYLTHDKEFYFDVSGYPTFLSSLDDHLMFIYTSATNYVDVNIYDAIKLYSEKFEITYSHKEGFTYDPPVWKLTRCMTDSFLIDKTSSPLSRDYVPCGYQFDSYNNKLDTMIMK